MVNRPFITVTEYLLWFSEDLVMGGSNKESKGEAGTRGWVWP